MSTKRHRPARPPSKQGGLPVFPIVLVGVVLVAALLTVVAVVTSSGDDGEDAEVFLPAPTLEGTDLDGEPLTIPADGAKVVVFLAHWCPHCQAEVPLLVDWIDGGGVPDGVEVYGVATANDPNADNFPAADWLAREGWEQPTLVDTDDDEYAAEYGVEGFPYLAFVDADGTVVSTLSGEQPISEVQAHADALVE